MRFRIRVARVQSVERVVNATDEQAAIVKIESELRKPYGLIGAWTTLTYVGLPIVDQPNGVGVRLPVSS